MGKATLTSRATWYLAACTRWAWRPRRVLSRVPPIGLEHQDADDVGFGQDPPSERARRSGWPPINWMPCSAPWPRQADLAALPPRWLPGLFQTPPSPPGWAGS